MTPLRDIHFQCRVYHDLLTAKVHGCHRAITVALPLQDIFINRRAMEAYQEDPRGPWFIRYEFSTHPPVAGPFGSLRATWVALQLLKD